MTEPINWHAAKRKLSELKPCEWNPRQANEKETADLTKSLERFNLADPIIINTNNEICGGHFRYKILKEKNNGKDLTVDVRVPNRKLTDAEMRELNIRLNKNTGDFNLDLLANFDEELLKDIGFESEELDKIFQLDQTPQDDVIPEVKKTNIKLGDMFQLGRHKLLCADCTKKENVDRLMAGKKTKLIFTSPPYNMASKMYKNYGDNLKSQEYIDFNLNVINNIKKYLEGFLFWNLSYNKNSRWEWIEIFYRIIKNTGLKFLEHIIWDKGHGIPITSDKQLTREYEHILAMGTEADIERDLAHAFLGTTQKEYGFNKKTLKGISNYWRITTSDIQLKEHLACFPIALVVKAILLMTQMNDIILDIFLGSGSTLIACEKTNRICYGMEISEQYCQVILDRWEKYTALKSKKI